MLKKTYKAICDLEFKNQKYKKDDLVEMTSDQANLYRGLVVDYVLSSNDSEIESQKAAFISKEADLKAREEKLAAEQEIFSIAVEKFKAEEAELKAREEKLASEQAKSAKHGK